MSVPPDQAEATFALQGEDHTMGNAIRYMLNKNPHVSFAGYSVPHPSDDLVHIRVQTAGTITATQALREAVTDLSEVCSHVRSTFQEAVEEAKAAAGKGKEKAR